MRASWLFLVGLTPLLGCADDASAEQDAHADDTQVQDTAAPDTAVQDTPVTDTAPRETQAQDTAPADTAPADTAPSDGRDTTSPPEDQLPIQVILNVHNHSPASTTPNNTTDVDVDGLHCKVRSWLRVADGWLHMAEAASPAGLSGVKFSFMLDGHFTAWNTYHKTHEADVASFCTGSQTYASKFIKDTNAGGAAFGNAWIDLGAMLAAGHAIGIHTHCHTIGVEAAPGYPQELFWKNGPTTCQTVASQGDQVLDDVQKTLRTALAGLNYTPTALNQNMGTRDWRKTNGYKDVDAGFDGLLLKNVAHPLWNPHRLCCVGTNDDAANCHVAPAETAEFVSLLEPGVAGCDPEAARLVGMPELAQAGASNAHGARPEYASQLMYERGAADPTFETYGANNELTQMKKTFMMIYHERRMWQILGLPQRVWTLGYATHDSRTKAADLRYDAGYTAAGGYPTYDPAVEVEGEGTLPQFYGWVAQFVASGDAQFATFDSVEQKFEAWEATHTGSKSVGLNGFQGPNAAYPYELKFNRLLGPGYVRLDGSKTKPGVLTLDIHDIGVGGYDMGPCDESGPYEYANPNGTGAPTRLATCAAQGNIVGRYVEVWKQDASTQPVDVGSLCGTFTCSNPYIPMLDYDQDETNLANASFDRADAVQRQETPRLAVCAKACCNSASACGDAGWSP